MIKPIKTFWNGRVFRSRLEARWAVFYDTLGIEYEYEKEGYNLGSGLNYLPDFWLPEQGCWVEIKPIPPTELEIKKASALSANLGIPVYIAVGAIGMVRRWAEPGELLHEHNYGDDPPNHIAFFGEDGISTRDDGYLWTRCPSCGRFGIQFQGRCHRLCGCEAGFGEEGRDESRCESILIAYLAALTAQFDRPTLPRISAA